MWWMPTPTPTPTPTGDPTPMPVPTPEQTTIIVNEIVQAADPTGFWFGLVGAVAGVAGVVTGGLAIWWRYRDQTKPRMEIIKDWMPGPPFRYGHEDPENPGNYRWWSETTHKARIRNWGNGIAYDVRLHTDDGVQKEDWVLGNLETGKSVEQEFKHITGPDRKPRAWVTWHEYPGPKEKTHEISFSVFGI